MRVPDEAHGMLGGGEVVDVDAARVGPHAVICAVHLPVTSP